MPLRPCPDCKTDVSTNASACPKCGHRFVPVALLAAILGIGGVVFTTLGILMFRPLHEMGVTPFGHLAQDDEMLRALVNVRRLAYAAVICGVGMTIGACIAWRRRKR